MRDKIFDPENRNLEDLFAKSFYEVPIYQRPYSWDKEEVKVLLDDLYEAYESTEIEDGYFVGNIIYYNKNRNKYGFQIYDIIDGQQRITTFALILLVLYNVSLSNGVDVNDHVISNIRKSLWKTSERKFVKDARTISLSSIDKNSFENIYNFCYEINDNNASIIEYIGNCENKSIFEERITNNFIQIWEFIIGKFSKNIDAILSFADFLLRKAQFVVIQANCNENKVFAMFESINSKGKKLDEIDIIKTYIFSKLSRDNYDKYLDIWGRLIIETDDNLYDYLYTYIKAFINFYRQSISIKNFKKLCEEKLISYFKVRNISEALEKLLDDLINKLNYYKTLNSIDKAYELVKSTKFRFYYKIFIENNYKHPKPLFLRVMHDYDQSCKNNTNESCLTQNDIIDIVVETIQFVLIFLSIFNSDSKDAITLFSDIMNEIYKNNKISKKNIINKFSDHKIKLGIRKSNFRSHLESMEAYEKNRKLSITLLALSQDKISNKISYDKAFHSIENFNKTLSLDHLLPQNPKKSSNFKYYKDEKNNSLVLKEGNDFPDYIFNGMDYSKFILTILNKIGNLRILYKDTNSSKSNQEDMINSHPFNSYKDILENEEIIINILIEEFKIS
ncbi:MAG: DUF262 domain-containing protein [Mycoplasmoidaceae bacterium]